MVVLLLYSLTLLAAVLLSDLAHRTVLSTAVLFLVVGIAASAAGVLHVDNNETVRDLAELALISVLFTDGLKVSANEVLAAWRLPGRALLIGLPLTVAGIALLAAGVTKVSWPAALLVGAALGPTSPIFAAAFIENERVPIRLRRLLTIEGSLTEALALPILLVALAWLGADHARPHVALLRLLTGVGIGVAVAWIAGFLESRSWLRSSRQYQPILPVAVIAFVYCLSELVHANEFIAAAAAGVTLTTVTPGVCSRFCALGEWVSELLKLAALLIFGGFFSVHVWREVGMRGIWFALLAIVVVRPIAMGIALWHSELPLRERAAAAWVGPKGFASVLLALLILEAELPGGHFYYELVALTIVGSIVVHSTTDILVAKWLDRPGA